MQLLVRREAVLCLRRREEKESTQIERFDGYRMSEYWEYKIEWVKVKHLSEKKLNKLGKDGWELAAMDLYGTQYKVVFKRRRST